MSKTIRYRQYWMATLKNRHACSSCGVLALNAEYEISAVEIARNVVWLCDEHLSVVSPR